MVILLPRRLKTERSFRFYNEKGLNTEIEVTVFSAVFIYPCWKAMTSFTAYWTALRAMSTSQMPGSSDETQLNLMPIVHVVTSMYTSG